MKRKNPFTRHEKNHGIHSNPIQNHIWIFELHIFTRNHPIMVFLSVYSDHYFDFQTHSLSWKNPVQSPHTFFRSLKSTSSRTFTLNAAYFSIQRDKRTSVFLCVKKAQMKWSIEIHSNLRWLPHRNDGMRKDW